MTTRHSIIRFLFNSLLLLVLIPFASTSAPLRPCLQKLSARDTNCIVWVIFSDKDALQPSPKFASRALARRARVNFPAIHGTDLPLSPRYIGAVERLGGRCRAKFAWANAASFSIHASELPLLAKLQYVKDILPVRTMVAARPRQHSEASAKTSAAFDTAGAYGSSAYEMRIPGIPAAHNYLINSLKKTPGDSVIIGMFDSGFRLNHKCFNYLLTHHGVIADSNFVDRNGEVSDPDSVRQAFQNAGSSPPEEHGSWTLSLIAGYDPGKFIGAAWGAHFVLAKTEWVGRIINGTAFDVEIHAEEDNWAAAVVWAEQLGVDIVSSSVAYRSGFTDSLGRPQQQDDYTFNSFNGNTTIISIAASEATKRGMIIVNSAGNDGPDSGSINAPGDVEDVITVGGVTTDKSVAYFSSRGPTADGRIKPDLVAPATVMVLPVIYSPDSASYISRENGTSFAAPLVAGICALIRQVHPDDDAAAVRRRLYASCVFHRPEQIAINNSYGRGIPDALTACKLDTVKTLSINLALYPTTLDIIRKKQRLTLKLTALPDNPLRYSQLVQVSIMSIDGTILWRRSDYCTQNQRIAWGVDFWPPAGKSYAPGMYYCVISYAGKTYTKKFIIAG